MGRHLRPRLVQKLEGKSETRLPGGPSGPRILYQKTTAIPCFSLEGSVGCGTGVEVDVCRVSICCTPGVQLGLVDTLGGDIRSIRSMRSCSTQPCENMGFEVLF